MVGEPYISDRAKTNSKLFKTKKQLTAYWIGYWDGQASATKEEKCR